MHLEFEYSLVRPNQPIHYRLDRDLPDQDPTMTDDNYSIDDYIQRSQASLNDTSPSFSQKMSSEENLKIQKLNDLLHTKVIDSEQRDFPLYPKVESASNFTPFKYAQDSVDDKSSFKFLYSAPLQDHLLYSHPIQSSLLSKERSIPYYENEEIQEAQYLNSPQYMGNEGQELSKTSALGEHAYQGDLYLNPISTHISEDTDELTAHHSNHLIKQSNASDFIETAETQSLNEESKASHEFGQKPKKRDLKLGNKLSHTQAFSEQDLEAEIENFVNQDEKVIQLEGELNLLKSQQLNKKDLQVKRNRLTAQLSRDRKKAEVDYLKKNFVEMRQALQSLLGSNQREFCQKCQLLINQNPLVTQLIRVNSQVDTAILQNFHSPTSLSNSDSEQISQRSTQHEKSKNLGEAKIQAKSFKGVGYKRMRHQYILGSLAMVAVIGMICFASLQGTDEYTNQGRLLSAVNEESTIELFQQNIEQNQTKKGHTLSSNSTQSYPIVAYSHPYSDANLDINHKLSIFRNDFIQKQALKYSSLITQEEKNQIQKDSNLPYYYNLYENSNQNNNCNNPYDKMQETLIIPENKFLSESSSRGVVPFVSMHQKMEEQTSSILCSNSTSIIPSINVLQLSQLSSSDSLAKSFSVEDQFVQFLVPANQMTFVDRAGDRIQDLHTLWGSHSDENVYIEFGCKVFEINRVTLSKNEL